MSERNLGRVNGVTFTPQVSPEGVISWSNDGMKENPAAVNIRGPQGPRGIQGPRGLAGPGAVEQLGAMVSFPVILYPRLYALVSSNPTHVIDIYGCVNNANGDLDDLFSGMNISFSFATSSDVSPFKIYKTGYVVDANNSYMGLSVTIEYITDNRGKIAINTEGPGFKGTNPYTVYF